MPDKNMRFLEKSFLTALVRLGRRGEGRRRSEGAMATGRRSSGERRSSFWTHSSYRSHMAFLSESIFTSSIFSMTSLLTGVSSSSKCIPMQVVQRHTGHRTLLTTPSIRWKVSRTHSVHTVCLQFRSLGMRQVWL